MENNPEELVTKQNLSVIFSPASYRATTQWLLVFVLLEYTIFHVPDFSKPTCDHFDTGVISYLPLYSPAPKRSSAYKIDSVPTPEFSKSETGTLSYQTGKWV